MAVDLSRFTDRARKVLQLANQEEVEYRDVVGFPGYRVGSDGSIWSLWLRGAGDRRGRWGGACRKMGTIWVRLTPAKGRGDHLFVSLNNEAGKRKFIQVHTAVLTAFVGPCPEGMECCHFPDRDPTNNNVGNLRWDTRKANRHDQIFHGTGVRGERQGSAKLTAAGVVESRRLRKLGWTLPRILKHLSLSVSEVALNNAIKGRTWAHV